MAKNKAKCRSNQHQQLQYAVVSADFRGTLLQFCESRGLLMDLVFCDFWLMLPEQIFISKFCCMHNSRLSVNQTFSFSQSQIRKIVHFEKYTNYQKSSLGRTPCMFACNEEQQEVVKLLLDHSSIETLT